MQCNSCDEWNEPREPFEVYGNTYYVGSRGLSSLVIVTDAGLVLVDAALTQSVTAIDANIRALGFDPADIKYILTSHAHYDHVGGIRAMQRYTGGTVLASAATAEALALGHPVPGDPQFGTGPTDSFPAFTDGVRVMTDGESVSLGGTTITAHYTPGHTPGATSWTWQSCQGERCLNMVYLDSLTAISTGDFRYTDHPDYVAMFRASLQKVAALPCDVVVSTHPVMSGMDAKVKGRADGKIAPGAADDPFITPGACKALAATATKGLDARLAQEATK